MNNKYALVTGGNRGIGYYFAKELAKDGYNLVLVGRDEQRLQQASCNLKRHGAQVLTVTEDLGDFHASKRIYDLLEAKSIDIEILVNNAGFGSFGHFIENDIDTELNMIDVNIRTLVHLTHLFANKMKQRGSGKIVNVASVAGFQAGPYMNVYFASKNFVLTFSEALAYELRDFGITVTALCPGSTQTDFFNRAKVSRKADAFQSRMSPMKVAKIGFLGMKKGKRVVVPGLSNKMAIHIQRLLPRKLVTNFLGKGMAKK